MSHDQLFKDLLTTFFFDFLALFAPDIAAGIDPGSIFFRNPEVFTDIPDGKRRLADLVAEVRTLEDKPELILIHTEVQRRRRADFGHRMWEYNAALRLRTKLPTLSFALVLSPGTNGISLETLSETHFGVSYTYLTYWQIGLRDLRAADWVEAGPVLVTALAALMRPDPGGRAYLRRALLQRIRDSDLDEARVFLLVNAVETYLALDEVEEAASHAPLDAEGAPIVETTELDWATELTWADKIQLKAQLNTQREIALRQIRRRFNATSPDLEERIATADAATLDRILDRIVLATSLEDFLASL